MISEDAIIEVNKVLGLCDTYLLTQGEIDYLNQIGNNPVSLCEYYDTAQVVMDRRAQIDTSINASLQALTVFAGLDGCTITLEPEVVPVVDIPVFAGSL